MDTNTHTIDTSTWRTTVKMKGRIGKIARKSTKDESGRMRMRTKMTSMMKTLE